MDRIKYFIGVVPPDRIYQRVLNIQKQFGDNRLEPHITIRPPVIPDDPRQWTAAITAVCTSFPPFTVTLSSTGKFGERVLFIGVRSKLLGTFHTAITAAIKPFERTNEQDQQDRLYTPHLTLGRSWCGFTREDFDRMQQIADEFLSEHPVAFDIHFVRIYYKPTPHSRYITLQDIPLTGMPELKQ